MTSRVRLDLAAGTLEAEGSEEFVLKVYRDFRERSSPSKGSADPVVPLSGEVRPPRVQTTEKVKPDRKTTSQRATGVKQRTPVLVKELDLATKGTRIGLKGFLKRFRKLKGAQEHNTVFVYYLARIASVAPITMNHVYTCFKDAGVRPPTAVPQSLWDTARRKGTIDSASVDDIKLTLTGENWVDHDLEKADAEAGK